MGIEILFVSGAAVAFLAIYSILAIVRNDRRIIVPGVIGFLTILALGGFHMMMKAEATASAAKAAPTATSAHAPKN